jgi:hypothetical protein
MVRERRRVQDVHFAGETATVIRQALTRDFPMENAEARAMVSKISLAGKELCDAGLADAGCGVRESADRVSRLQLPIGLAATGDLSVRGR